MYFRVYDKEILLDGEVITRPSIRDSSGFHL
jgi:hypothetical protein